MSLPSKDRLCKRPSGVELGLMRKRGFGGKLNLIARMKRCGIVFKKKPRMLPFLEFLQNANHWEESLGKRPEG